MNENIDLTKILKDCPKGTEFYHLIYGKVYFVCIDKDSEYPIRLSLLHTDDLPSINISKDGKHIKHFDGECILFPSKDQKDWSKFKIAKPKFDPKTLQPFDRVLVKDRYCKWSVSLFLGYNSEKKYSVCCNYSFWEYCIPYNDETKHLVGTTDEAPEYYRYWE